MANVIFGKKDIKFTKTPAVKRKKKNQPTIDENIYIGIEEPISKSKRLKITQFKQPTGKGRPKQSTRGSEWPAMNLVRENCRSSVFLQIFFPNIFCIQNTLEVKIILIKSNEARLHSLSFSRFRSRATHHRKCGICLKDSKTLRNEKF